MDTRVGTISIFVNEKENINVVNNILSDFSEIIISRLGTPYKEKMISVIVLIVDGTMDQIGSLTGKLGNINGVQVKSAVAKIK